MTTPSVHKVLATSYIMYFLFITIGLFLDLIIPFRIAVPKQQWIAIVCFATGPLLMAWAQYTSYTFEKVRQQTGELRFKRGPYQWLRNPTQIGLLVLFAGYALATGAIMLFCATVVAYALSNIFFKKHEQILEERYGDPYRDYKSSVKKVL